MVWPAGYPCLQSATGHGRAKLNRAAATSASCRGLASGAALEAAAAGTAELQDDRQAGALTLRIP